MHFQNWPIGTTIYATSEELDVAKEKVLILVKTYPTLSTKYGELACTAGIRPDGSWIRLYPIKFRYLQDNQKYRKYQWVELDVHKNSKDPRPESFRPTNIDDIQLGEIIDTGKNRDWAERRRLLIGQQIVYTDLADLIAKANSNQLSLAIFKPTKILDFIAIPADIDWSPEKVAAQLAIYNEPDLFDDNAAEEFTLMPKLPYKFSYRLSDINGVESTMMVEDWEVGQLYWSCVQRYGESQAVEKVRKKYLDEFSQKDLHLFLGTTRQYHGWAKNPFVIIGTFHPPIEIQGSLL